MEENKESKKKKIHQSADLYLEGGDQFRGWFNSSLTTSTILNNSPPYHQVVAHGFVVDAEGHKMSKSLGNVIDPNEIIEKYGVDVIRLWVASVDFTKEIKASIPLLQDIQGSYQKIRNTLRFLLGNLFSLTNENQLVKELEPLDEWILAKLDKLTTYNKENYQKYNFNLIYQSLLNFCINDLSPFYFEISKDSLYCDSLESPRRKQVITTLYYLLAGLLKIINPLLPFLSEEVYEAIPFKFGYAGKESVMFLPKKIDFPSFKQKNIDLIEEFLLLRQDIFLALEKSRQTKIIYTNSQANVSVISKKEMKDFNFSSLNLSRLLSIAQIEFVTNQDETDFFEGRIYFIKVEKTSAARCIRCWNYEQSVNSFPREGVCSRCWNIFLCIENKKINKEN